VHDTEIDILTGNLIPYEVNISFKVKYKTGIIGSTWVCETD